VLTQARETLKKLEQPSSPHATPLFQIPSNQTQYQEKYEKIQRILSQADPNNMTPLQALQFLAKTKEELIT
jgi:DNA mismatch repair ATPase MutS